MGRFTLRGSGKMLFYIQPIIALLSGLLKALPEALTERELTRLAVETMQSGNKTPVSRSIKISYMSIYNKAGFT